MTRTIAYVACADSHEIAVLGLDPASGALAPLQRVATGGTVMPLAVSPDRRRLYASIRSAPFAVLSFAIDPGDGTLTPLGTSPLPASMCWIGLDRSGRWLLSASYGESLVAVSPIGDDGAVGPARQTVGTAPNAHSIQTDPANRFAFAACLGGDVVLRFRLRRRERRAAAACRSRPGGPAPAPGRVTSRSIRPRRSSTCSTSSTPPSTRSSTMSTAARFGHVQTIATCRPASSASPGPPTSTSRPDGRFLYTSERRSSTLAAFAVDPRGGWLTLIGQVPTAPPAARLRRSTRRAAGCSPSARRRTGCASTRSTRRPACSPTTPSTRSARTRTGSRSSPSAEPAPEC